jgi:hypothetical protein
LTVSDPTRAEILQGAFLFEKKKEKKKMQSHMEFGTRIF